MYYPLFVRISRLYSTCRADLGTFAVKHYLRVLELAGEWQKEHPEVNLSTIGSGSWVLILF
jgi:hypothetical protein